MAVSVVSCRGDSEPQREAERVAKIEPAPERQTIPAQPEQLQEQSVRASSMGNAHVADLLSFYSQSARAVEDVQGATITSSGNAAGVIQEHFDTTTPLDEVVSNSVAQAAEQGVTLTKIPMTVDGHQGWRIEQPSNRPDVRIVELWFNDRDRRWSVHLVGEPAEVERMAEAVRVG